MELSKHLKQVVYLGLSAVMVGSLGTGAAANVNASRIHHHVLHIEPYVILITMQESTLVSTMSVELCTTA